MMIGYNSLFIARVSLSLATLMALAAIGSAQVSCPIGGCPVDQITNQDVQSGTPIQADSPQVRVRISGSCGSGFIAGADATGAYVITNAHVVGTQIGREATVDVVSDGQQRSLRGRVALAMYHSQRLIDAAVVRVDGLTSKRYLPMLKELPSGEPFETRGAPRCVWPLVTKPFDRVIVSPNSPLIRGLPDAIGGQSGSAIHNANGQAIALLAWSWGGYCAGQQTHWLWKVATERSLTSVPFRPNGLDEVSDTPENAVFSRPVTEDGIFEDDQTDNQAHQADTPEEHETGVPGLVRPATENGIFNLVDSRLAGLPIWFTPGSPDPQPDPCPNCPECPKCPEVCPPDYHQLTAKEWELIEFLRAQQDEASLSDLLKDIDWVKLARQIIEIIKLFQSLQ
jgi:hypothetical protein